MWNQQSTGGDSETLASATLQCGAASSESNRDQVTGGNAKKQPVTVDKLA